MPCLLRTLRTAALFLAALTALSACVSPATEVVVQVATDVPANRLVTITATATAPSGRPGMPAMWAFDAASPDAGARSATFAVVPGTAPRDSAVTLTLDGLILPLSPRDSTITLRRRVSFRFVPGRTVMLPVFLSARCLYAATGCTTVSADRCTRTVLCEEQGQTCGDQGNCVTAESSGADAGLDAACTPVCAGRMCGDDGCGGSCGTCSGGTGCDPLTGHCVCIPQCDTRSCGPDGCGGECGHCGPEQICSSSGACAYTCGGPGQPCCTTRAACLTGLMCNGSTHVCEGACGSIGAPCCAGSACSAGSVCTVGTCAGCPSGRNECDGACVNLATDEQNCGRCGRQCAAGFVCVSGGCQCRSGQTDCGGFCVSVTSDANNCGSCGHACAAGSACCNGTCLNTATDTTNCGACARLCATQNLCVGGICTPCGNSTLSCCAGGMCTMGTVCDMPTNTCRPCGAEGGRCCAGNTCNAGQTCNSTRTDIPYGCYACGGPGQPCCNGTTCQSGAGLTCTTVITGLTYMCTTTAPNSAGSACTMPSDCPSGSICRNGWCYECGHFDQFCCPNAPGGMCSPPYACNSIGGGNYVCY